MFECFWSGADRGARYCSEPDARPPNGTTHRSTITFTFSLQAEHDLSHAGISFFAAPSLAWPYPTTARFEEVREQEPPRAPTSTQKAYFEVEGRPGSQPDPHPPKESGQGTPEPVRITEVRVNRMVAEQPGERDGAARTPPLRRESYATSDSRVLKPRAAVPEPGSQPRRSSSEHLFSQT